MKLDWHLDGPVVGLSLLTISPGFASSEASPLAANQARQRAMVETAIIAVVATVASKSWWPLAVPAFYLAFDWAWLQTHPTGEESPSPLDEALEV